MNFRRAFIPIVLVAIVAGIVLVAGSGTYTGITYYQSKKLIKQADESVKRSNYADAVAKYEKARKKWHWAKIDAKKAEAIKLLQDKKNIDEGNVHFGKGEWDKCQEYLGKVGPEFPQYAEIQERYSDCKKKLDEAAAAAATANVNSNSAANTSNSNTSSKSRSKSSSSTDSSTNSSSTSSTNSSGSESSSNTPETSSSDSQTQARPVLSLPFSVIPPRISPMGETLYHGAPQGHPGIDFIWPNSEGNISIIASLDATVTVVRASEAHAGAYDVTTRNGRYGVDYTEMGSAKEGLKVGDTVHVGDVVGYAYHPAEFTDLPNYKMIHWQFGYEAENPEYYNGVADRLCPMTYFSASAKSTIEGLWATTDWAGVDMKGNAPDICSGYYAGRDS